MGRVLFVLVLLAIIGGVGTFLLLRQPQDTEPDLKQAEAAFASGDFAAARKLSAEILANDDDNDGARMIAAAAELQLKNPQQAVAVYDAVSSPEYKVSAQVSAAEIVLHEGALHEASSRLHTALQAAPDHEIAHRQLAFIYNITGRRREAQPHLFALVRQGRATLQELVMLGNTATVIEISDDVMKLAESNSQAADIYLGAAAKAYFEGDHATATRQLDHYRQAAEPDQRDAPDEYWFLTGRRTVDTGTLEDQISWWKNLPAEASDNPDLWMLKGEILLNCERPGDAAQCFRQAIFRDPNHQLALYRLGSVLTLLNQPQEAQKFTERADLLRRLAGELDQIYQSPGNLPAIVRTIDLCDRLQRPWESGMWQMMGWQALGGRQVPHWASAYLERGLPQLTPDVPQTLPDGCLIATAERPTDLLPELPVRDAQSTDEAPDIAFRNVAEDVSLRFQYTTGLEPRISGRPMYSFPGGGTGVIDIDLDGWPDLYLPQGCAWPPPSGELPADQPLDTLFRNQRGETFEDVTSQTGIREGRFSHGVSVGDFDNDGFPDIYVANIFGNRLFHNLGDGTFEETDFQPPQTGWTTSCVIADLNNDGLPDLYDVNYATGEDIYESVCEKEGVNRTCTPIDFEPEQDRYYLNRGDGRFIDSTSAFGLARQGGYGLGIVVADLNGDHSVDVFVANDASANFFFPGHKQGQTSAFQETAIAAGLAVDGGGNLQACMGIAAGDADGDLRPDLFVTNYYQEHNVLYTQPTDGLFVDSSGRAGLYQPSYMMLGFGTQFVDADLDSWPDLIVTNGHVDDFQHTGAEYAMRPQFFRNLQTGQFAEPTGMASGEYFSKQYLGRGLAVLDWNRDGRQDVIISHLDHPAALLENATRTQNQFLTLRLHGTNRHARDAIGSSVVTSLSNRNAYTQLTAGDGYMASNQRVVHHGLSHDLESVAGTITWPGGSAQEFLVHANKEYAVVEGRGAVYKLPK